MCVKHSFCMDRSGRIYQGHGLLDGHAEIVRLYGLVYDDLNHYEAQPGDGWPADKEDWHITMDRENWVSKSSHSDKLMRYLAKRFPNQKAWDDYPVDWRSLELPNWTRVKRHYDMALQAKPLSVVPDNVVLTLINQHLAQLEAESGIDMTRAQRIKTLDDSVWDSVWESMRESVQDSVWDSVWESVRESMRESVQESAWESVWESVRAPMRESVDASMVLTDAHNPFMPLLELATYGAYLYGITDDGIAYVLRGGE